MNVACGVMAVEPDPPLAHLSHYTAALRPPPSGLVSRSIVSETSRERKGHHGGVKELENEESTKEPTEPRHPNHSLI